MYVHVRARDNKFNKKHYYANLFVTTKIMPKSQEYNDRNIINPVLAVFSVTWLGDHSSDIGIISSDGSSYCNTLLKTPTAPQIRAVSDLPDHCNAGN